MPHEHVIGQHLQHQHAERTLRALINVRLALQLRGHTFGDPRTSSMGS